MNRLLAWIRKTRDLSAIQGIAPIDVLEIRHERALTRADEAAKRASDVLAEAFAQTNGALRGQRPR